MNPYEVSTENDNPNEKQASGELSFTAKANEYVARVEAGKETIEQILNGIRIDGSIYRALKQRFYEQVPHSCRDNTNHPFPFPILEEFLRTQTLSVDTEKNIRDKRVRDAILYFSKTEWDAHEQQELKELDTQEKIQELRATLGAQSTPSSEADTLAPQETISPTPEKITFEKTLSLPERTRQYNQESIGDLNGSYEGLIAHLTNRDLISMEGDTCIWTGHDTRLVLIGDILGDRTPEGLKIYTQLLDLKRQAEKVGGDIEWLSGNHENMFNAVLCGFSTEFGVSVEKDMENRLTQYAGNLELAQFLPDEEKREIVTNVINVRDVIRDTIQETIARKEKTLRYMQSSPDIFDPNEIATWQKVIHDLTHKRTFVEAIDESLPIDELLSIHELLPKSTQTLIGNKILQQRESIRTHIQTSYPEIFESLVEQKLIQIHDDVLYTHTNLTKDMIDVVLKNTAPGETLSDAITKINAFYSMCLRSYLENPQPNLSDAQISSFNKIRDTFISTSSASRINFFEDPTLSDDQKRDIQSTLTRLGVNLVIHGHNDENGVPKGSSQLPILSIDRSAYKSDNPKNYAPTSASAVSKNGIVSYV